MRLKIRTKIILSFFAPIIPLSVAVVIVSVYLLNNLYNEAQRLDDISKQRIKVTDLRLSLDRVLMPANDYIITGDRKYADDFNVIYSEVEERLKTVEDIAKTPQENEIMRDVKDGWQNIREISLKIFSIPKPAGNKDAMRMMEEMDYKWGYPAIERLKRWREIDLKKYEIAFERHQSSWRQLWISIISEVILFLSISAIYMIFYSRTAARNEEVLRESEERYRGVFEKTTNAMVIFDSETWRFEDVNYAAIDLYGYTKEEFLSLTVTDMSAEVEKTRVAVQAGVAGELTHIPLRYHKKKDGTVFPIEIFMGTFFSKGRKKGFAVIVDHTERKKAEELLNQRLGELERFQKVAVKREFRIRELQERVKELEKGK